MAWKFISVDFCGKVLYCLLNFHFSGYDNFADMEAVLAKSGLYMLLVSGFLHLTTKLSCLVLVPKQLIFLLELISYFSSSLSLNFRNVGMAGCMKIVVRSLLCPLF